MLPSIHKHGVYVTDEVPADIMKSQEFAFEFFKLLGEEIRISGALLDKVETLASKARCDLILQCDSVVQVSLIAKDYGMTVAAFNRLLHDLSIQFRIGPT